MKKLLCIGLGYSARILSERLMAEGWSISGTCRDDKKAARLSTLGITPYVWSADDPFSEALIAAIGQADAIVHSVPPQHGRDAVFDAWQQAEVAWQGEWFGYLCTTGVYGDARGDWVDEESPLNASGERQQWRVDAERTWLESGLNVHSFRLAGIYGPERNNLRQLQAGTAHRIVKEGQWFSRIHVEDIANVLYASMHQPNPGRVYNVCDDMPAPSHEVMEYAASLLGVEPPPAQDFSTAELSPMARSFYSANRRVRNHRIKDELGVELSYPDYRAGLLQCHLKLSDL